MPGIDDFRVCESGDSSLAQSVIRRGESLAFTFCLNADNPEEYTCTIYVKANPDAADAITPREIERDDCNRFTDYLTSDETDLAPGMYFLVAVFTYDDKRHEQALRFRVKQGWV